MKNDILENLRNRLANMSQEEIDADYEELKQWTNIGPSIDEFIEIQEYGYHWIQCHSMFNKSYLENKNDKYRNYTDDSVSYERNE